VDRDLIAALSSLAKTYETLVNSNLIYEPPTANLAHQNIVRDIAHDIEAMVREFRETERQHSGGLQGHKPLRDSDVLKALVFLLRMGLARTSGRPKSRAFLDSLLAHVSRKAIGHQRARRDWEPDRDSLGRISRLWFDGSNFAVLMSTVLLLEPEKTSTTSTEGHRGKAIILARLRLYLFFSIGLWRRDS
jgi:hypothetical protein